MKTMIRMMASLLVAVFMAPFTSSVAQSFTSNEMSVGQGALINIGISAVISFAPAVTGSNAMAYDAALLQMWEAEVLKKMRWLNTYLGRIPNRTDLVKANAINITEIGADPTVRVDPTVYPVPGAGRTDSNNVINLHLFETENTYITYKEMHGYPIEKEGSVIEQHRMTLEDKTNEWATYNLSIDAEGTNKFLVKASGAANLSGVKAIKSVDIALLKKKYDDAKVPLANRVLLLSSTAVNDLLNEDKAFTTQYHNHTNGLISKNYYGFEIYEDRYTPYYDATDEKLAWGAVPDIETDSPSCIAFYLPYTFRCAGEMVMSAVDVRQNTAYRRTEIGFNHWNHTGFKKMAFAGALIQEVV